MCWLKFALNFFDIWQISDFDIWLEKSENEKTQQVKNQFSSPEFMIYKFFIKPIRISAYYQDSVADQQGVQILCSLTVILHGV